MSIFDFDFHDHKEVAGLEEVIVLVRGIFEQVGDDQREEIHRRMMEGYCSTCAHKTDGTCWNCYDSRGV